MLLQLRMLNQRPITPEEEKIARTEPNVKQLVQIPVERSSKTHVLRAPQIAQKRAEKTESEVIAAMPWAPATLRKLAQQDVEFEQARRRNANLKIPTGLKYKHVQKHRKLRKLSSVEPTQKWAGTLLPGISSPTLCDSCQEIFSNKGILFILISFLKVTSGLHQIRCSN